MAHRIDVMPIPNGKELMILYPTNIRGLKRAHVTAQAVPTTTTTGDKTAKCWQFKCSSTVDAPGGGFSHVSQNVPQEVVGELGRPAISVEDGEEDIGVVKVTYKSKSPIGDIHRYFDPVPVPQGF